jgi:hypothetical protein
MREWPVEQFGDPQSRQCISVVKILNEDEAYRQLAEAESIAVDTPNLHSIKQYIEAAAISESFPAFIDAISMMVTHFPDQTPIVKASGVILSNRLDIGIHQSSDLLATYSNNPLGLWEIAPLLRSELITDGEEIVLLLEIEQSTQEPQPVFTTVLLKRNTAYILDLELRSSAPFDLVRFPKVEIPDSYPDSWNKEFEWTRQQIVFVTPNWNEAMRPTQIELVRLYDRGELWFRQIRLIEVDPNW